jgi:glutamate--cysteine ligase
MSAQLIKLLDGLLASGQLQLLTKIQHGIEKEGLRVDAEGRIAQTDHPRALGAALTHSRITTDYSEALLEFITPVFQSVDQALQYLQDLHCYTYSHLGEETVWSASIRPTSLISARCRAGTPSSVHSDSRGVCHP